MDLFIIYLAIINALSLLLMLLDKEKAKRNRWRIPERTLLGICALGGSLGGFIAMVVFRHKTKHIAFALGIPVMLIIHCGALYLLHRYL